MLETLLGCFAFGTLGFWGVIIALSIIYTIATEQDTHAMAVISTIVAGLLLWHPLVTVMTHWHLTLIILLAYGAIGGAWSVFRWFKYCRAYIAKDAYHTAEASELRGWKDTAPYIMNPSEFYASKLNPSKHKSRLIGWISYWPWSLVWTVSGDFLTGIYDALSNVYSRIALSVIEKATSRRS
jgi:hypothetical protein